MGNTRRAVNLMRDLSPEQRDNLMKHVIHGEMMVWGEILTAGMCMSVAESAAIAAKSAPRVVEIATGAAKSAA